MNEETVYESHTNTIKMNPSLKSRVEYNHNVWINFCNRVNKKKTFLKCNHTAFKARVYNALEDLKCRCYTALVNKMLIEHAFPISHTHQKYVDRMMKVKCNLKDVVNHVIMEQNEAKKRPWDFFEERNPLWMIFWIVVFAAIIGFGIGIFVTLLSELILL
jgi:hypothetical protein